MTKIICLTGGIGSGKSTVAQMFKDHGIPIYIADTAAKGLTETPEIQLQIRNVFTDAVFTNNQLDRKALASVVFNDAGKLSQLNAIIHPAVQADFLQWLAKHNDFPLLLRESAIVFESGTNGDCSIIITVVAPADLRIARVLKRDQTTYESIVERIENQWTDDKKIANSTFVIHNVDLRKTHEQVKEILKKLHNF